MHDIFGPAKILAHNVFKDNNYYPLSKIYAYNKMCSFNPNLV